MSDVDRARQIEEAWHRERPDLDASSVRVITRIWHLAKIFGDDRRRLLATLGIEPALLDLLGTLRRAGEPWELSTRQLAERTVVSPAAISQRLTRAESHRWVTRSPGPGRSTTVRLTKQGKELIDEVAGKIFDHENELLRALPTADREALADHLERLVLTLARPGPLPPAGDETSR